MVDAIVVCNWIQYTVQQSYIQQIVSEVYAGSIPALTTKDYDTIPTETKRSIACAGQFTPGTCGAIRRRSRWKQKLHRLCMANKP